MSGRNVSQFGWQPIQELQSYKPLQLDEYNKETIQSTLVSIF